MSSIDFSVDERKVARLTLNRPEVRNAFNAELIGEITRTVKELPDDVRVLVLAGAGKSFSTGADLEWMKSMATFSHEENLADSDKLRQMFEALDNCRVPVIGRIHGAAIAGATGLVACCDYAVAAESTIFAFSEVKLGLIPAVISPYVLRKVGYSFARAMFLTAEQFDASHAHQVGLVHRVVPEANLDTVVDEVVGSVLQAGPHSLRSARNLLEKIWNQTPSDAGDTTVDAIAQQRVSDEGQEGMSAFLEKRKPRWT